MASSYEFRAFRFLKRGGTNILARFKRSHHRVAAPNLPSK
jgi:hypothetical protein